MKVESFPCRRAISAIKRSFHSGHVLNVPKSQVLSLYTQLKQSLIFQVMGWIQFLIFHCQIVSSLVIALHISFGFMLN